MAGLLTLSTGAVARAQGQGSGAGAADGSGATRSSGGRPFVKEKSDIEKPSVPGDAEGDRAPAEQRGSVADQGTGSSREPDRAGDRQDKQLSTGGER